MSRIAIVMLACRDYEAMEIALACHAAFLPDGIRLFVLQNCRGCYDSERTLEVARRYAALLPGRIVAVDSIPPGPAYRSIATLLASPLLADHELICKVDDDAFPVAPGWLDELTRCWDRQVATGDRPLAYVTPLINNNCWGFPETLDALGLREEFLRDVGREHLAGVRETTRLVAASFVDGGGHGTIWRYPHLARWIHERTTLDPDRFVAATKGLSDIEVPGEERYSIGCILFRRTLWHAVDDGGTDDEHMLHEHCRRTGDRIVCARSVPFVHLSYFTQREENRDLIDPIRATYEPRLRHPFPIAGRRDRIRELESRLRWMERRSRESAATEPPPQAQSCEIVVARYNEDVAWTTPFADFATIYNKGEPIDGFETVALPNKGREAHTYLHHIVENYDSLADRTLFIQGSWFDHMQYVMSPDLSVYFTVPRDFVSCGPFLIEPDWDAGLPHHGKWLDDLSAGRMKPYAGTLGDWWDRMLQIPRKPRIGVQWAAIFAASRQLIHRKPKAYYEHLLSNVEDHPNPESAHYFERSWYEMLTSELRGDSPFASTRPGQGA